MKDEPVLIRSSRGIRLMIAPAYIPRQGWENAFSAAQPDKDEPVLERISGNRFDRQDWKW